MATYFVSGSGSNTAPYDTWAKAATSLATVLAAATTDGDIIAIDVADVPTTDKESSATLSYGFSANVSLISSTNSGTATITPSAMGASMWLGSSTVSRIISLSSTGKRVYTYGITLRNAATTNAAIGFSGDGSQWRHEDLYIWQGTTNATPAVTIAAQDQNIHAELINPTFRFGSTGHRLAIAARVKIVGGSVSSSGSAPANGLIQITGTDPGGASVEWIGGDLSHVGSNALVASSAVIASTARFIGCKLGTAYTMLTASETTAAGTEVYALDCSTGDTHGLFEYHNAQGSLITDTGIYVTAGAAGRSWKIVTTANVNYGNPFVSPWIPMYHDGTTSITPRLEILRDGSTTAYTDAQVWSEWLAKTTSGTVLPTRYSDRQGLADFAAGTAGAAQANGAGLGSWTGESGTAWSGKLEPTSAFTPSEAGDIAARVCVAAASATVYVNPEPLI